MKDNILEISVSVFKATCLAVLKDLEKRKYSRVVLTRRGRPIAELKPLQTKLPSPWGCLRGTVKVRPGVDLTAPAIDEPFDAPRGVLHR